MSREAKAASRFRGLLASERSSADLYSGLADAATGERREVLTELAAVERNHAAHWADKLSELGEPVPPADRPVCEPRRYPGWLADSPSRPCCPTSSVPNTPTPASIRATLMRQRRWPSTSARMPGS